MNQIVVIIAAVIAVAAVFYARSVKTDANSATLSAGQALGAGIVGLGILLLAMPYAAGAIAALEFISSSDFGILSGAVYAIGILAVVGGILLVLVRGAQES
ncbi:MAG: hypothetical protein IT317_22860 [Anaerolineales bacterium]|nr:hypothetical protein [Anaerolineales bacterium]